MKIKKFIIPIIAIICVAIIALLAIFSKQIFNNEKGFTLKDLKSYTITFESEELEYTPGVNFMQGVTAVDEDNNDLTKYVTVSCKPTNNIKKKTLTYSINQMGYDIKTFERSLVIKSNYNGPSITMLKSEIEIPLDEIQALSSLINASDVLTSDDGFGNPCTISASISDSEINVGEYVATIVAENILGDTAESKITVSVTPAKSSKIKLTATSITVNVGDKINPADYIANSTDEEYGDLTPYIQYTDIDTSTPGVFGIEYSIKGIPELQDERILLTVTVK